MSVATPAEILQFWFGELSTKDWFRKDVALDERIATRFRDTYQALSERVPDDWLASPEGCLAAVIVLDQFPRNMFRNDKRSFATDAAALALSKRAIAARFRCEARCRPSRLSVYAVSARGRCGRSSAVGGIVRGARKAGRARLRREAQGDHRSLRAFPASERHPRARLDGGGDRLPQTAGLVVLTSIPSALAGEGFPPRARALRQRSGGASRGARAMAERVRGCFCDFARFRV